MLCYTQQMLKHIVELQAVPVTNLCHEPTHFNCSRQVKPSAKTNRSVVPRLSVPPHRQKRSMHDYHFILTHCIAPYTFATPLIYSQLFCYPADREASNKSKIIRVSHSAPLHLTPLPAEKLSAYSTFSFPHPTSLFLLLQHHPYTGSPLANPPFMTYPRQAR